jgi:hypothetical protein
MIDALITWFPKGPGPFFDQRPIRAPAPRSPRSPGMLDLLPEWIRTGSATISVLAAISPTAAPRLVRQRPITLSPAARRVRALLFGLVGRTKNGPAFRCWQWLTNMVRGVPDVLFFLFFPLAFEQLGRVIRAQAVSPAAAAQGGLWPPVTANWYLDSPVPDARLRIARHRLRAFHQRGPTAPARCRGTARGGARLGMSPAQVPGASTFGRCVYALPGLSMSGCR